MFLSLWSRLIVLGGVLTLASGLVGGLNPAAHAAPLHRLAYPATACQTLNWRQGYSASQKASNQDTVTAMILMGDDPTTHEFCGAFQSVSTVTQGQGTGGTYISTLILWHGNISTTASSGSFTAYGSFTGNLNDAPCAQAQTTYFPNGGTSVTVTTPKVCPQSA